MSRLGLAPEKADKLFMALAADELLEVVNIALKIRKGQLQLTYVGHEPFLLAKTANADPEPVAMYSKRQRKVLALPARHIDIGLTMRDMQTRLHKKDASMVLGVMKDKHGRSYAKLQISSRHSRHISMTLDTVMKGQKGEWLGPFEMEE